MVDLANTSSSHLDAIHRWSTRDTSPTKVRFLGRPRKKHNTIDRSEMINMCWHVTVDNYVECNSAREMYFPRAVEAWKYAENFPEHATVERCTHTVPGKPTEGVIFEIMGKS